MPPAASALYAYDSEFTTYAAILSLALSFQIDPPAEFALFAQMCVTLDNQVKMHNLQCSQRAGQAGEKVCRAQPGPRFWRPRHGLKYQAGHNIGRA